MKTNIHNRWALGALFFTAVGFSSIANATLVGRLAATPGGTDYQAYYDTDTNLTWLADANYAKTSGYDADGTMTWTNANTWAAGLNVAGIAGWRLPTTVDVGNDGATFTHIYQGVDAGYNMSAQSEMSNMYYNVLGNKGYYDISGNVPADGGLRNPGPFRNIQNQYYEYWSATEYAPYSAGYAWAYGMGTGSQGWSNKDTNYRAWAVHSGDVKSLAPPVSAVPVPAALWLFGSGLIGFIGLAKRKTRTLAA